MATEAQEIPDELIELATHLSMELGIPLLEGPIDLGFVTECVNCILGALNSKWKPIEFEPNNEKEEDEAWRKLFQICEVFLLSENERILESNEEIGLEHVIALYEILCQGCEALRQENLSGKQMNNKGNGNNFKEKKRINKTYDHKNPEVKKKPEEKKEKKSLEKESKFEKKRPQTSINSKKVKEEGMKLQNEILNAVAHTIQKTHIKKAEANRTAKIREKEGTEAVEQAKRALDATIKEYKISNRLASLKNVQSNKKAKDVAGNAYMKMIETKHKKINEDMENEQLKYYLELRDKKIAYIQHIHKLMEKLEREREIESHKQQKEINDRKKQEMKTRIQSVDNLFNNNMQKLKENYNERKKVKELQQVGELEICRALDQAMKQKKAKEVEDIKDLWKAETSQLHKITSDEEKMKAKLIDIYRKYRI